MADIKKTSTQSLDTPFKSDEYKELLLQAVALLPWLHNLLILNKDLSDSATLYYAQESVAKGWSRELLLNALKLKMHESQPLVSMEN